MTSAASTTSSIPTGQSAIDQFLEDEEVRKRALEQPPHEAQRDSDPIVKPRDFWGRIQALFTDRFLIIEGSELHLRYLTLFEQFMAIFGRSPTRLEEIANFCTSRNLNDSALVPTKYKRYLENKFQTEKIAHVSSLLLYFGKNQLHDIVVAKVGEDFRKLMQPLFHLQLARSPAVVDWETAFALFKKLPALEQLQYIDILKQIPSAHQASFRSECVDAIQTLDPFREDQRKLIEDAKKDDGIAIALQEKSARRQATLLEVLTDDECDKAERERLFLETPLSDQLAVLRNAIERQPNLGLMFFGSSGDSALSRIQKKSNQMANAAHYVACHFGEKGVPQADIPHLFLTVEFCLDKYRFEIAEQLLSKVKILITEADQIKKLLQLLEKALKASQADIAKALTQLLCTKLNADEENAVIGLLLKGHNLTNEQYADVTSALLEKIPLKSSLLNETRTRWTGELMKTKELLKIRFEFSKLTAEARKRFENLL
jgi:hypothetical protein